MIDVLASTILGAVTLVGLLILAASIVFCVCYVAYNLVKASIYLIKYIRGL